MKIAFIGTHGVGKTTLCYDLASRGLPLKAPQIDLFRQRAGESATAAS